MPARKSRPADEKPQAERFADMARELGVPEDEAAFETFKRKLAAIARHETGGSTGAEDDVPQPHDNAD